MKKGKYYILVFIIPILIFLLVASLNGFVPFGDKYFNIFDAYVMYPSLLEHSIQSIKNGNLFFTFFAGLGTDYYNIHTLYMNSPLNYLYMFFKLDNIFDFYTLLIYLRIGLSSLTMFIYLNSLDKKSYLKNIFFSCCYSLSTYSVAYQIHIMWMDSFILLPLIILGLDKLIDNKKSNLYIIFLSICLLINFYIGYMVCIFCLLYFIYKSYNDSKLNKDNILRFIISSLLSGLVASIVLIPQIISLFGGRGNEFSFDALKGITNYSLDSFVYGFFPGFFSINEHYVDGAILLYCSFIVLLLNILFYFNKSISKRVKISTLIFMIFIFLSSFVNIIDYSWNMFQAPVWWGHRYAFVFVFFLIVIAYKNSINFDVNISKKCKVLILLIFGLLSIISFSLKYTYLVTPNYKMFEYFILLILFCFYLYTFDNKKFKYIILVIAFLELGYNAYSICNVNVSGAGNKESVNYLMDKREIFNDIKDNDDSFYRIMSDKYNYGMFYKYNSVNLFSSSYNGNVVGFLKNKLFDYGTTVNSIYLPTYDPLILSLFDVKYLVNDSNYFDAINDNVNINSNVLPLGFVISDFKESNLVDKDYINNKNKIINDISNSNIKLYYKQDMDNIKLNNISIDNGVYKVKYNKEKDEESQKCSIQYEFISSNNGVLVPYNEDLYEHYVVYVNDKEYDISSFDGIVNVNKGDNIVVKYSSFINKLSNRKVTDNDFSLYVLDENYIDILHSILNYDKLNECKEIKNGLECNINVMENGYLFTTIPYYNNYIVKVDDKKVEYGSSYHAFLGMDLEEGEHKISISYVPKGFNVGIIVSLLSVLLSIVYVRLDKK